MKKILVLLISFCVILSFTISASATNLSTVSAEDIVLKNGEQVVVPVNLSDNMGIMGFKMTIEYPTDQIEITTVSKGKVTSVGNFNNNLGSVEGKFDIIWNSTTDVKINGSLFVLSVKAVDEIQNNAEIKLSFSQPDTFNEAWEDVVLNCQNIKINATDDKTDSESTTKDKVEETTTEALSTLPADPSQITDAVDITLDQNDIDNLDNVEDEDDFVDDFNKNIEAIVGNDKQNVDSLEDIKELYNDAYKDEFVKEVIDNFDSKKIQNVIDETLKEFNARSIDDLKEEDKQKFVEAVEEKLKAEDSDIPNISNDLKTDNALDIIKKLYKNESIEESDVEKGKQNNVAFSICASVLAVLVIGVIFFVLRKRKINN